MTRMKGNDVLSPQEMESNGQLVHGHFQDALLSSRHDMTKQARLQRAHTDELGTILVPIDFSSASQNALRQAAAVARDSSRIILLHVIAPAPTDDLAIRKSTDAAERKLGDFCKSDGLVAPELIQSHVRNGTPFREIVQFAEENNVAMIVLGVHESAPPFGGIALGHTIDRVSRYAPCPVLLVREGNGNSRGARNASLRAHTHEA